MNLHTLKPAAGSVKKEGKRLGRGEGSGKGGTSTKGHKGQQSRAGYNVRRGHEGGQTPIQRRLPKRGFKNIFRIEFRTFNLSTLNEIAAKYKSTEINLDFLTANKLASKNDKIKILGNGELNVVVNVKAHAYSAKAKQAIEAKGGKAETI
jgi:large subunit ribosomal protein L15